MDSLYYANLAFICNFTDGKKDDEVVSELSKIMLQVKGTVPYDRDGGAGLQEIEQESDAETARIMFTASFLEEVYKLNERRNFDPFIVVGYDDITMNQTGGRLVLTVTYRFLENVYDEKEATLSM